MPHAHSLPLPSPRALRVAALTLALVAATPLAHAAPGPDINAQSFELAPGLHDGTLVRSARKQGDLRWLLAAGLHYTRRSLVFANRSGTVPLVQTVHGDLWMVDLAASTGWGAWTFEAALPVALGIRGGGPDLIAVDRPLAPAFGDLRLGARRHLWQGGLAGKGVLDVAVGALWAAPTGAAGTWLSNGGARVDLMALVSWRYQGWQFDVVPGLRLRPLASLDVVLGDPATGQAKTDAEGDPVTERALSVGSEALLQIGVSTRWLDDRLGTRAELAVRGAIAAEATPGQTLADVLLTADWALQRGAWRLFASLGGAPTSGYGSSQVRLVAGMRFDPHLRPHDSDGDGLDDRDDRCPNQAEDKDGFEDGDGCPDLDNDKDGVPDVSDKCPLTPEDKDGRDDADGCPELDDDKDGVPDSRDRCPTKPEDKDGFEDGDGCPEPDNDGDGILDVDDLCPDAREDKNGYQDQDGCPDVPPPAMVSDAGARLRVRGRVTFVPGTPDLTADGRKVLTAVARFMAEHKELTAYEVTVHTDTNGDRKALFVLSNSRARAVKAFLVRTAKLQVHQVRAVGRGALEPIADNKTLAGRSANRRVEFKVLARTAPPPKEQPATKPAAKTQPSPTPTPKAGTQPAQRPGPTSAAGKEPAPQKPKAGAPATGGPPAAQPTSPSPTGGAAAPQDGPPPARPTP